MVYYILFFANFIGDTEENLIRCILCDVCFQVSIVSVAYSQSELLQKEVYLVELVDSMSKESMMHLKAVYFLRPTSENIQHLRRQLTNPRFGEYHLCMLFILYILLWSF